jgi:hypothetical protein
LGASNNKSSKASPAPSPRKVSSKFTTKVTPASSRLAS